MRKIAAHYIFPIVDKPIKYGIITLDDENTIIDISESNDTLPEMASVEFYNGIIVPGLVNAHCHLELSHMQNLLEKGKGMSAFCEGIIANRKKNSLVEQQLAASIWDKKMFSEGVIAVGDISNTSTTFEIKQKSQIYYHTFIECLGLDITQANTIINNGLTLQKQASAYHLNSTITLHAPYSMSEILFNKIVELAQKENILSIHNQESKDETELFLHQAGKLFELLKKQGLNINDINHYNSPIERIAKQLNTEISLLLIHNVYTSMHEVDYINHINKNTTWVLCPNSNLFIEKKLPPVSMFYKKQQNIAIGTDSLSSNDNLSILDELKTLTINFPEISLTDLLYWATLGGAKALLKNDTFGSFEIGKRPGVVLIDNIDFNKMCLTPKSNSTNLLA